MFELKPIKREGKIPFQQQSSHSNYYSKPTMNMSSQLSNNNNYTMAPASPNPYISRKLNNMDQAQVMKKEREEWSRLYHKMLKGIEAIINVQRIVKDMKKIVEETNMTITEIEGTILMASINNWTVNTMNITQISEDL